jgi:3-hydroxyisobutyrate dehydrogenase-like beta-hydroxyacid dehydrogenase
MMHASRRKGDRVEECSMRVGLIGLGEMGLPMARNLAAAGHDVAVFDRDPARLGLATDPSLVPVASVRAAGRDAEIVHVVVFADEQVLDVVAGAEGLLGIVAPGAKIVLHSTIRPRTCRRLAAQGAEHGVAVLDAGMTGAAVLAERGELTLLVGGDAQAVEECRPEFAAIATSVKHVGPSGAGMAGKIINNLLVLANAEVLREMFALAASAGVDEDAFLGLVSASTGRSWVSDNWARVRFAVTASEDGHYAAMSRKDCRLAAELADECGVPVPTADLVAAQLARTGVSPARPAP